MKEGFYIYENGDIFEFFQIKDGVLYTHNRGYKKEYESQYLRNKYTINVKPHAFGPVSAAATWLKDNSTSIHEVQESDIFLEMI